MTCLPIGKLPADLLHDLLDQYVASDPRVVVGPGIGEDAAIIEMGDRYLVAKTDPITFATDDIGWYAVHVNANDLACCGAIPRWYLATLLLPEGSTTPKLVETIFSQLAEACRELRVALCGGHTEITHDLKRPIVVGQMLGEVDPDKYITTRAEKIGDALILTKGIAIEGTAIIAKRMQHDLRNQLPDDTIQRCTHLLYDPGISVVKDAQIALGAGGVHAFHDPTEGGVATGLWELAKAAKVGLTVDVERLPILPECAAICQIYGLHPLGLIASGSLLIAARKDHAPSIIEQLSRHGIAATVIGEAVPIDQGRCLRSADGSLRPLPTFQRDELARLF